MASWPSTLPTPLQSSYQGDTGVNVQRTDFDAGPARQRMRYGDSPHDLSVGWKFKPDEMQIFKSFWEIDINKGTDWFLMDLQLGSGLLNYEVRFIGGKYQYQLLPGNNWQVSAKFDVRVI